MAHDGPSVEGAYPPDADWRAATGDDRPPDPAPHRRRWWHRPLTRRHHRHGML